MRGLMTIRHAPPQPGSMLSAWKLPHMEGIATLACWLLRHDTEAPPDSEMTFLCGSGPEFDAWEPRHFKPSCYGASLRGWAAFIDATPPAAPPPPPPPPPPPRAHSLQPLPMQHAALPSACTSTAGPEHRDLNVSRRPRQRTRRGEGADAGQQAQATARRDLFHAAALAPDAASPPPPPRARQPHSAAAAVPARRAQAPSAGGAGQRPQRVGKGPQSQAVGGPVPAATAPPPPDAYVYAPPGLPHHLPPPPPPPPRQPPPPPPSPPPRVVGAAANLAVRPMGQAVPHAGALGQRVKRMGRAYSSEQPAAPGHPRTPQPHPTKHPATLSFHLPCPCTFHRPGLGTTCLPVLGGC